VTIFRAITRKEWRNLDIGDVVFFGYNKTPRTVIVNSFEHKEFIKLKSSQYHSKNALFSISTRTIFFVKEKKMIPEKVLQINLYETELPEALVNTLKLGNIHNIGELLNEMYRIKLYKNIGSKSVIRINKFLKDCGLSVKEKSKIAFTCKNIKALLEKK